MEAVHKLEKNCFQIDTCNYHNKVFLHFPFLSVPFTVPMSFCISMGDIERGGEEYDGKGFCPHLMQAPCRHHDHNGVRLSYGFGCGFSKPQ